MFPCHLYRDKQQTRNHCKTKLFSLAEGPCRCRPAVMDTATRGRSDYCRFGAMDQDTSYMWDLPGDSDGKRNCLRCRRPRFSPWVRTIPWRRKRQPIPVFLPGEFHGQRNLVGYGPWDHKESDTTDQLTLSALYYIYMCLPGGSDSKESTCNAGGLGSVPGLGRSPGEGNGN